MANTLLLTHLFDNVTSFACKSRKSSQMAAGSLQIWDSSTTFLLIPASPSVCFRLATPTVHVMHWWEGSMQWWSIIPLKCIKTKMWGVERTDKEDKVKSCKKNKYSSTNTCKIYNIFVLFFERESWLRQAEVLWDFYSITVCVYDSHLYLDNILTQNSYLSVWVLLTNTGCAWAG